MIWFRTILDQPERMLRYFQYPQRLYTCFLGKKSWGLLDDRLTNRVWATQLSEETSNTHRIWPIGWIVSVRVSQMFHSHLALKIPRCGTHLAKKPFPPHEAASRRPLRFEPRVSMAKNWTRWAKQRSYSHGILIPRLTPGPKNIGTWNRFRRMTSNSSNSRDLP